jgi:hypothetical protein
MIDLVTWSALLGTLLPPVVAVVNQAHWPSWLKGMVAVIVSIVTGAITAAGTGQLTGKTWVQATLIVAGATFTAYHFWWRPTGISDAIERATSANQSSTDTRLR